MNPQICMCNAEQGYPHATDCPYPLYGSNKVEMDKWHDASACLHQNVVVESRGSRRFVDGTVDDDITQVLVCTDCGRELVDMDRLYCKGCGETLPKCNCDLPF